MKTIMSTETYLIHFLLSYWSNGIIGAVNMFSINHFQTSSFYIFLFFIHVYIYRFIYMYIYNIYIYVCMLWNDKKTSKQNILPFSIMTKCDRSKSIYHQHLLKTKCFIHNIYGKIHEYAHLQSQMMIAENICQFLILMEFASSHRNLFACQKSVYHLKWPPRYHKIWTVKD